MSNTQTGGCRCGATRYEIDLTEAHTLNCHCLDCQKHLGAPFSVFTVVPAVQFRWIKEPKGTVAFSEFAIRRFCTSCGTYLKWEGMSAPHEAEVNAMTLDNPARLSIDKEIFVRSRLAWIRPIEGVPQYNARSDSASNPD